MHGVSQQRSETKNAIGKLASVGQPPFVDHRFSLGGDYTHPTPAGREQPPHLDLLVFSACSAVNSYQLAAYSMNPSLNPFSRLPVGRVSSNPTAL